MGKDRVEMIATTYEGAIKATLDAAKALAPERRTRQVQDGKAHQLWLMGHLGFAWDTIVNVMALGGTPQLPQTYFKKFAPGQAGGDPVSSKAADYPSWDEVVSMYEKAGNAAVAKVRSLDDGDLPGGPKGTPPDAFKDFFKVLGTTLGAMGQHDAYHRGQMGMIGGLK